MKQGQFFELLEHGNQNDYTIYHWTRVINESDIINKHPYFIVFEPEEITFYKYSEDSSEDELIQKEELLSIPYYSAFETSKRVEECIVEFFNPHENKNTTNLNLDTQICRVDPIIKGSKFSSDDQELQRCFFLDFLWDLKINKFFKYSDNYYKAINLIENTPIIYGIFLKMYFNEFSGVPKFLENSKENHNVNSWFKNHYKNAKLFWLDFLTKTENEYFFIETKRDPYFRSIDKEIESIYNKKLEYKDDRYSKRYDDKKVSTFLLKRYDYFNVLNFFTDKFTFRLSQLTLCLMMLLIVLDLSFVYNKFQLFEFNLTIWGLLYVPIFSLGIILLRFFFKENCNTLIYYLKILVPQMFLPRLIIAISSGWLVFYTSDEMFGLFNETDPNFPWLLLILSLIVLFFFMYNEMSSLRRSSIFITLLRRMVSIICISFIISYGIGIGTSKYTVMKKKIYAEGEDNYVLSEARKFIALKEYKVCNGNNDYADIEKDMVVSANGDTLKSIVFIEAKIDKLEKELEYIDYLSHIISNMDNTVISYSDSLSVEYVKKNDVYTLLEIFIEEDIVQQIIQLLDNNLHHTDDPLKIKSDVISYFLDYKIDYELALKKLYKQKSDIVKLIKEEPSMLHSITNFKIGLLGYQILEFNAPLKIIFRRAILAMFIGVFLQLIIQDRSITEPV